MIFADRRHYMIQELEQGLAEPKDIMAELIEFGLICTMAALHWKATFSPEIFSMSSGVPTEATVQRLREAERTALLKVLRSKEAVAQS